VTVGIKEARAHDGRFEIVVVMCPPSICAGDERSLEKRRRPRYSPAT
jgi:hypothetical protein